MTAKQNLEDHSGNNKHSPLQAQQRYKLAQIFVQTLSSR